MKARDRHIRAMADQALDGGADEAAMEAFIAGEIAELQRGSPVEQKIARLMALGYTRAWRRWLDAEVRSPEAFRDGTVALLHLIAIQLSDLAGRLDDEKAAQQIARLMLARAVPMTEELIAAHFAARRLRRGGDG